MLLTHRYHRHGFTLVELMVVIVILGVLSTIGATAFFASQKKARDNRRKQEMAQVARALEMYYSDHNAYPDIGANGTIKGCLVGAAYTDCAWGSPFKDSVTGTVYMQKLPTDPSSGQRYYYYPTNSGYYLLSKLENTEGPDPDIPTTGSKVYYWPSNSSIACSSSTPTCNTTSTNKPNCCNYYIASPNLPRPSIMP